MMSQKNKIRAIVYGVGSVGKLVTKYMVCKGVNIVGAIDVNPDIAGKDLGEVAGLSYPLNVKISNNADGVLSEQEADIAVVSLFSQIDRMYPIFKKCVENGLNVISPAEEALYPWGVAPELAAKLDRLAKKHGVTITASGSQDSFRVNMLAVLTGASYSIESVTVRQTGNLGQLGPATAANYHIGDTKDEFYQKVSKEGLPLVSLQMCLEALAADLGLTIRKVERSVEPMVDEADVVAKGVAGGIVRKGLVTGITKVIDMETEQGIKFHGEQILKAFNESEKAQGILNECFIKGVPDMHLVLHVKDVEPTSSVVAQLVNRIPDVINCEPGFVTIEKLPKLKFRAFPLEYYLG